jgi:hypothetical protein
MDVFIGDPNIRDLACCVVDANTGVARAVLLYVQGPYDMVSPVESLRIDGGSLLATDMYVYGYPWRPYVLQTNGGEVSILRDLVLGDLYAVPEVTNCGDYTLEDGILSVGRNEIIGPNAAGGTSAIFTHSGGTNYVQHDLYLGPDYCEGWGQASYMMSGGLLQVDGNIYIAGSAHQYGSPAERDIDNATCRFGQDFLIWGQGIMTLKDCAIEHSGEDSNVTLRNDGAIVFRKGIFDYCDIWRCEPNITGYGDQDANYGSAHATLFVEWNYFAGWDPAVVSLRHVEQNCILVAGVLNIRGDSNVQMQIVSPAPGACLTGEVIVGPDANVCVHATVLDTPTFTEPVQVKTLVVRGILRVESNQAFGLFQAPLGDPDQYVYDTGKLMVAGNEVVGRTFAAFFYQGDPNLRVYDPMSVNEVHGSFYVGSEEGSYGYYSN